MLPEPPVVDHTVCPRSAFTEADAKTIGEFVTRCLAESGCEVVEMPEKSRSGASQRPETAI